MVLGGSLAPSRHVIFFVITLKTYLLVQESVVFLDLLFESGEEKV